jgi:predicted DsbA family dithiol-disulfide isomerase
VHDLLFRAFFVDGRDIGDIAVLGDLAGAAGLDRSEALGVLEERSFRDAVDEDWARARELAIRVAPTFLTGGRRLEGMKPYDVLEAWLRGDALLNAV